MKRSLRIAAVLAASASYFGLAGCAATATDTTSQNVVLVQIQAVCANSLPTLNAFLAARSSFQPDTQAIIDDVNSVLPALCADASLADAGANLATLTQQVLPQIAVLLATKAGL